MAGWPHGRSRDGGIDELPLPHGRGQLWLCGKHAIAPDVSGVLARLGADRVVCLVERHELVGRYDGYVNWLEAESGRSARWYAIPDLHAPDLPVFTSIVDEVAALLGAGHGVVMHCAAGIGRTGTLAAALLVAGGMTLEDALAVVADCRPMAGPEAGSQRAVLEAYTAAV